MENTSIYQKIDTILQNKEEMNLEELLSLFKILKSDLYYFETKADENNFYNYIDPEYYVKKLETLYSGFIISQIKRDGE